MPGAADRPAIITVARHIAVLGAVIMQSLDLEYHNLDLERGLYNRLVESGEVKTLVAPEDVEAAIHRAPDNTRARIRGQMVEQELDNIGEEPPGQKEQISP